MCRCRQSDTSGAGVLAVPDEKPENPPTTARVSAILDTGARKFVCTSTRALLCARGTEGGRDDFINFYFYE